MKALVLLSGTIRSPEKSLATLKLLHDNGWETDVFVHTWINLADIDNHVWSPKSSAIQPALDILEDYQPKQVLLGSWMHKSVEFQQRADHWAKEYDCTTYRNHGVQAMFWGMQQVAKLSGVLEPFSNSHVLKKAGYSLILRLRFDCQLLEPPQQFGMEPGWCVPGGARPEERELQDMVAWYIPDQKDLYRCPGEIAAYFETYAHLDRLIRAGCRYKPEELLYQSMASEVFWRRVPANWLVHYGVP